MNHEMNINTRKLLDLGQPIWLGNLTREMLNNGTLARCIAELPVTGLTFAGATLPADGGCVESVLHEFKREGVDDEALAARLQQVGVQAFARSWSALMARIREKVPAAKAEQAWTT